MITHEQSVILKGIRDFTDPEYGNLALLDDRLYRLWGSRVDGDEYKQWLRPEGLQALAEYDAHYTTVEKSELARLQALERKIEAFLGSMRRTKCAIEIGTPEQMWVSFNQNESCWEVNLQESVDGRYIIEAQSHGDAMRKTFELFELFEVPKEAEG